MLLGKCFIEILSLFLGKTDVMLSLEAMEIFLIKTEILEPSWHFLYCQRLFKPFPLVIVSFFRFVLNFFFIIQHCFKYCLKLTIKCRYSFYLCYSLVFVIITFLLSQETISPEMDTEK